VAAASRRLRITSRRTSLVMSRAPIALPFFGGRIPGLQIVKRENLKMRLILPEPNILSLDEC
jgi:hypothetical protein